MRSQFGGIPVEQPKSRFGGVPVESQQAPQGFPGAGVVEPALAIATGAVAEPLAGLAGIGQAINPFAEEGAGARAVASTREALTFQPRTQAGKESLQAVGQALQPIGKAITGAETFLGDTIFKATGSPTLAAAATTLPTAILETIGLKGAGKIAKSTKQVEPSKKAIKESLKQSALPVNDLKNLSEGIFDELKASNVTVKKDVFSGFVDNLENQLKDSGLDARITPGASAALDRLKESKGIDPDIKELQVLRKVAGNVAGNINKSEAKLGATIVDSIEDFMTGLDGTKVLPGSIKPGEVGAKLKAANNLWGRARKSETLQEAIVNAKDTASGFENGLRIEFNKIIKSKKQKKFFRDTELDAMRDLVRGDRAQNFAKLIGRFGVSEGRSTNTLLALLGGGAGAFVGGGFLGALSTVAIGQTSKVIAQKLTKRKADFIDAVVRAGTDGKAVTKAYLNTVPKSKRTVADLSELLSDPTIDLTDLIASSNKRIREAAEIAAGRQTIGQVIGIGAPGAAQAQRQQNAGG